MEENEKEEFFEEKKGRRDEKSPLSKAINAILWVVLLAWMALCLIDFYNTQKEKDPIFCFFGKESTTYKDGRVDSCTGLGYKIYNYKRSCFNGIEYGPFWSKDRSLEADSCKKSN